MSQKTIITFLLDRTGSMQDCKDATIEAFNAYLKTLQEGDQKEVDLLEFTFLQFDSSQGIYKVCVGEDPRKVALLTHKTYETLASTPLVDCAYKTIKAVEEALKKRDDQPKVVICIQTDGHENASTQFTMDQLNLLIKEKTALGWQFIFMGASVDAYAQSQTMGISVAAAVSYDKKSAVRTQSAFRAAAANTRSYAGGATMDSNFSMSNRAEAGDVLAESYLNEDGTAKAPDLSKTQAGPGIGPHLGQKASRPSQARGSAPAAREPIVDDVTL